MKLTCHTDLVMNPVAVSGNSYQIIRDNSEFFTIRNEDDEDHSFSKDPSSPAYYGNWFTLEGGIA